MPTETLSEIYTTEDEVERLFSELGVELRVDDLSGTDLETFWEEFTSDATDIVNQDCEIFYAPTDMVNNRWVRSRATWICAYLVSMRRGNAAQFFTRYEEIRAELAMVRMGQLLIPRLATREDFTPAMSNQVVDDRFHLHKLRTYQSISTGGVSSSQHLTYNFPYDWL